MKRYYSWMTLLVCTLAISSCKKILDTKSSLNLATIASPREAQSVLDTYTFLNNSSPGSGETSADDYYVLTQDYNSISVDAHRRLYTWEKDNLYVSGSNDWLLVYRWAYYANNVLEAMDKVTLRDYDWSNVRGQAFFWRALSLQKASSLWAQAYDPATAANELGVPIRLTSDFNEPTTRSSLAANYEQIISDLKSAIPLLPIAPAHVMRPSKPAAYALLARTYLYMREYTKAALYADSCLQLKSQLVDLNTLSSSATYPMTQFNSEVIMHLVISTTMALNNTRNKTDSLLYQSYATNDLRRTLWFKAAGTGMVTFFGSYDGSASLFGGFATDEMYLTRAEALARTNRITEAMDDLNTLLRKRYRNVGFIPLTAANAAEALTKILMERRKELTMRDLRWMDIKRLNKEGAGIQLKRMINNVVYNLPANDPRFALAIPEDIIQLSGIQQNPR